MKKPTSKEAKPATAAKAVAAAVPVAPKAAPAAAKPIIPVAKPAVQAKPAEVAPIEKKIKAPATTTPVVAKAPVEKAPAPKEPAKEPAKAPSVKAPAVAGQPSTTLIAQIDVGFGNTLSVRGEGAGLTWEKGKPMENISATQWRLVLPRATTPVVFKFLINDERWSIGDDYVAVPGSTSTLEPQF